jgi:hypothetical protein
MVVLTRSNFQVVPQNDPEGGSVRCRIYRQGRVRSPS